MIILVFDIKMLEEMWRRTLAARLEKYYRKSQIKPSGVVVISGRDGESVWRDLYGRAQSANMYVASASPRLDIAGVFSFRWAEIIDLVKQLRSRHVNLQVVVDHYLVPPETYDYLCMQADNLHVFSGNPCNYQETLEYLVANKMGLSGY